MTDAAPEAPAAPPPQPAPSSSTGTSSGNRLTSIESSPILALLALGLGGYLAWFAVKYWRSQDVVWPSDPIKAILQGKPLPTSTTATTAEATLTSYETSLAAAGQQSTGGSGAGEGSGGPLPKSSGSAQNTAKMLLGKYGWGASELGPLISLWNRESGWSTTAWNPSGAYGIAQALGHAGPGECAIGPRSVGSTSPGQNCSYGGYGLSADQARAANSGSMVPQIVWGFNYIKATYGTPSAAWAHEEAHSWY